MLCFIVTVRLFCYLTNMKKYIFKIISIIALLLSSCSSIEKNKEIFEIPDYTLEDVRKDEAKKIEALMEKNEIQALWRACILNNSEIKNKCFEAVVKSFDKAVEEKNWFLAKSIYKSLKAVNYENLSKLSKSENELEKLSIETVPGIKKIDSSSKKVSSYINGTVTIWVDKGIAIHNGMGYADRVIGSGFFISEDGYIITNNHVIADVVDPKNENYSKLFIKLAEDSDTRIPAKVIGWDPEIDLALLKTVVDAPFVFNLGSSEDLDIGDKIFAIGSPIGLDRTLTSGIVSANNRNLFSLCSVMQIDAAVNSGNSGGPIIDSNGNVQAVVFAGMLQYEGLNFAIPIEYLKAELPALYSGGKLSHAWIGAYGHSKKEMGKDVGLEVQYILPGGSASRNGIKVGDVIVEADGVKISNLEDFQNILIKNTAKSIINIKFVHFEKDSEEEKSAAIYLSTRPENPGYQVYETDLVSNYFLPIYGMKLLPLNSKRSFSISNVLKGSIGDESGFSENDFIEVKNIKINQDNNAIYAELRTKNAKKGYLDTFMALTAPLNGPNYF